jgi:hypothetical protein
MSPECILLVLKQHTLHWECITASELTVGYAKQLSERDALKETQDEPKPTSDV